MTRQTINIGTAANDGTGDPIRTAFDKVNDNFLELYSAGYITANSLPTVTSELTNDSGYITANSLPTDITELNNDAGYITSSDIVLGNSLDADGNDINNINAIVGRNNSNDVDVISSGSINFRVDSENENNLFEFMGDGTFYTSKNTVNNRSYISTPRNDAAGIMNITSANEVIITANESSAQEWTFETNGSLTFPDSSVQTGASISLTDLKTLVAASTDFADFQSRIAAL